MTQNKPLLLSITLLLAAGAARAESPAPPVAVTLEAAPAGRSVLLRVASRDAHHRIVRVRRFAPSAGNPLGAEAIPVAETGLAARASLAFEAPVVASPGALVPLRFEVEAERIGDARRDLYVVDGTFEAAADGTLHPVAFEELAGRAPAAITLMASPRVEPGTGPSGAVPSR